MTGEDLEKELINGIYEFYGETINSPFYLYDKIIEKFSHIKFNNCCFEDLVHVEGKNKYSAIIFHDCIFDKNVKVTRCTLNKIQFTNLKKLVKINICYSKINDIFIDSNKLPIFGNIEIIDCTILNLIDCSNLNLNKGNFTLSLRHKNEEENFSSNFKNSTFEMANFSSSFLGNEADFRNFEIIKTCFFTNCHFKKVYFTGSNLGKNAFFKDCRFESKTEFKNCKSYLDSKTEYIDCEFQGTSHFNNSKFNNLGFIHSTFDKKASFEYVNVDSINLYQVTFSNGAFFENLKINSIENCDIKTLRAIKRELVNSHNQIDYLRFKAYELEAFKLEDNTWKDKFILHLNSYSSKNGLDWFRGFLFTIIISVCFFYLYSIIEVYDFCTNPIDYNFISTERVKEYFYFLNPGDFDYHFKKLKENNTNIGATIVFIFAKIFIGYGIYQTIQAFRKFGVNGG